MEDTAGTNYGSQFKNLGKLATDVNKEILSKLNVASGAVSSTEPSRYFLPISFTIVLTWIYGKYNKCSQHN